MKKIRTIALTVALIFVAGLARAYSIPYYNRDSKTHTFEVKINGSKYEITFTSSTTGTASCPPGADVAEILCECGWVTVKNGQKVEIKDGCVKVV